MITIPVWILVLSLIGAVAFGYGLRTIYMGFLIWKQMREWKKTGSHWKQVFDKAQDKDRLKEAVGLDKMPEFGSFPHAEMTLDEKAETEKRLQEKAESYQRIHKK